MLRAKIDLETLQKHVAMAEELFAAKQEDTWYWNNFHANTGMYQQDEKGAESCNRAATQLVACHAGW